MPKQYDDEFKEKVLKYHDEHSEKTVAEVVEEFGISESSFYNWKQELEDATDTQETIDKLKNELEEKTKAVEILKKAQALIED